MNKFLELAILFPLPSLILKILLVQAFASTAGGLRNRNAATFSLLKKDASLFFNFACGETRKKRGS